MLVLRSLLPSSSFRPLSLRRTTGGGFLRGLSAESDGGKKLTKKEKKKAAAAAATAATAASTTGNERPEGADTRGEKERGGGEKKAGGGGPIFRPEVFHSSELVGSDAAFDAALAWSKEQRAVRIARVLAMQRSKKDLQKRLETLSADGDYSSSEEEKQQSLRAQLQDVSVQIRRLEKHLFRSNPILCREIRWAKKSYPSISKEQDYCANLKTYLDRHLVIEHALGTTEFVPTTRLYARFAPAEKVSHYPAWAPLQPNEISAKEKAVKDWLSGHTPAVRVQHLTELSEKFRSGHREGDVLQPSQCMAKPTIWFRGDPKQFYAFLMADLDAIDVEANRKTQKLHCLVINIPGRQSGANVFSGQSLLDYIPPHPESGTGLHRYSLILFQQPSRIDDASQFGLKNRNALTKEVQAMFSLTPIGIGFFRAEWSPDVSGIYSSVLGLPEPVFEKEPSPVQLHKR